MTEKSSSVVVSSSSGNETVDDYVRRYFNGQIKSVKNYSNLKSTESKLKKQAKERRDLQDKILKTYERCFKEKLSC